MFNFHLSHQCFISYLLSQLCSIINNHKTSEVYKNKHRVSIQLSSSVALSWAWRGSLIYLWSAVGGLDDFVDLDCFFVHVFRALTGLSWFCPSVSSSSRQSWACFHGENSSKSKAQLCKRAGEVEWLLFKPLLVSPLLTSCWPK